MGGTAALGPLLAVSEDLVKGPGCARWFFTGEGVVKVVNGVDLHGRRGEVLALVGESGSGKSVS